MSKQRAQMSNWIHSAFLAVNGAFPKVNWQRESPEITKAQEALDWALFTCFYSDIGGEPTGSLDSVREAWRRFYKLHLPGQQELI